MKLLHSITSIDPVHGGPSESLKHFTFTLEELGHPQEIVTLDSSNATWIQDYGVAVNTLGSGIGSYQYHNKLCSWIIDNHMRFDAVIIHGIWQYQSYAFWRAAKKLKFPYFVFPHGALDPWFNKAYPFKYLKKLVYWQLGQYPILRDANAVLFTTDEERILARSAFWPYRVNEAVISYGITQPILDEDKQKSIFFNAFPQLDGKHIILFMSRLHEKKGIDLLLRAFAKVYRELPNLRLVIAGPDQAGLKPKLIDLARSLDISDYIVWTGMLSGDMKWGAYLSANVFVLPSHSENFGLVVAEAIACGKPVLITHKVNIWKDIVSDNAGLVENDTEAGVEKLLIDWISLSEKDRERMSVSAKECFSRRYNLVEVAKSFVQTLQSNLEPGCS